MIQAMCLFLLYTLFSKKAIENRCCLKIGNPAAVQCFAVAVLVLFLWMDVSAALSFFQYFTMFKEEIMTKTITLNGTEQRLDGIGGVFASIYNGGSGTVYASARSGISADADGVTPIPAGGSAIVECNGTVYLLGTGSVTAVGSSEPISFFKPAPIGGGTGSDVSKEYVDAQDITYLAQAKNYVNSTVSNSNQLINGNFKINQRGAESYTTGFTVDCWQTQTGFEVKPTAEGITVTPTATVGANIFGLRQFIPCDKSMRGKSVTFSTEVFSAHDYAYFVLIAYDEDGTTASSQKVKLQEGMNTVTLGSLPDDTVSLCAQYTINGGASTSDVLGLAWAKVEQGAAATAYCPPDQTTELTRCQRYYQLRSTGDIDPADLRPTMATITDIKERSDGLYEYIAAD